MPDRQLSHLYPAFRERVQLVAADVIRWCGVHKPGYSCIVTEGFRSTARQQELYAQGRTTPGDVVTQKNGTTNKSNHQSGLAVDFAPAKSDGSIDWDDDAFWDYLGHVARVNGLVWGGDWHGFVDKPHVEWPTTDTATYQAAHKWLADNNLA